ncbi:MAG: MCE family protein [Bacteroidetes bacterium]|nr:MCE family protein [Bacteroidota bacterium]
MKNSASQKIKIGIFTLVGLFLLVASVFLIGKRKTLFGNSFTINGTFKNVGGLQIGNNVRFVGINVGTVQNIKIISDTLALVTMRLDDKVRSHIKTNAVASISSDGLMGDKLVTITAGADNAPLIKEDGMIATVNPMELDKTVAKIAQIADNAEVITSALAGIATQVKSGKGSIGTLLYNDTLANNLKGTVKSAHEAVESVKKGTEGFSENMTALKHNFLLRGYFKKKKKAEEKKQKEMEKAQEKSGDDDKDKKSK